MMWSLRVLALLSWPPMSELRTRTLKPARSRQPPVAGFVYFSMKPGKGSSILHVAPIHNPPFFFYAVSCVLVFSSPSWPLTVWSRNCSVILALFSGLPPREQNSHLSQVPPNPLPGMRCASEGLGSQPTGNRHLSSCLISHSGNDTVTALMVRLGSGQLTG